MAVKSDYWGDKISVAGLITSKDLIDSINGCSEDETFKFSTVVIPSVMLRQYTEDFLDGKNLDYIRETTNKDFVVVENYYSTKEIVDFVISKAI